MNSDPNNLADIYRKLRAFKAHLDRRKIQLDEREKSIADEEKRIRKEKANLIAQYARIDKKPYTEADKKDDQIDYLDRQVSRHSEIIREKELYITYLEGKINRLIEGQIDDPIYDRDSVGKVYAMMYEAQDKDKFLRLERRSGKQH